MSTPVDPLLAELHEFPLTRFQVEVPSGDRRHGVIAAWDTQLQRRVACKCAVDPIAYEGMDGEELAAVFGMDHSDPEKVAKRIHRERRYTVIREARLLATIDHPNVIPVLDVGRMGKRVFAVVLPYLEGGTAEREFTGRWQDVLEIALQIGRGLAALHAAGILHRDIKPSNILLNGIGRPLIADLGLSCRLDDASAMIERVGTPIYMPPDVYEGGHKDVRDDLYSFCIVVFEMFYGQLPFGSVTDRDLGRVPRPTRVGGMPRALHEVLVRGLAPRRMDRWPNMKALLHAMERVRQPKRWPLAAAAATLAAGIAIGVVVDEGIAKADTCEDVMDELVLEWNDQARTELVGAFGTRKAGDGLDDWATRWLEVRAQECAAARDAGQPTEPTPCSTSTRDRFQATVKAFRSPLLRDGLQFASVIAELPAPEHCIDHPDDADWGYGGFLELTDIDIEVDALTRAGSLDLARARQADHMKLALELGSELGTARATYFRAEIQRLDGQLDQAAEDLEVALQQSVALGVPGFTAECLLSLAAIAGARGDMATMNAHALMAHELFARYRPERVAELLQVQGLALVSGTDGERERGVELLQHAMEMREEQLRKQSGSREWLSQARESYARGLLAVKRAAEAIELLDLALRVHQEEFGHGTWRTRAILMQKFSALVELRRFEDAQPVWRTTLQIDAEEMNWQRHADDAWWFARAYEDAGDDRRAAFVLHLGHERAVEHGLLDDVARFERALANIGVE
jgi:tRNA A-37 threonylcarbamoyl transferase component Bud32/tetratricopeptide (TPR) repeat protein